MATWSTGISLMGAQGQPGVVPVTAPPGPNVGTLGAFAIWPASSSNGNLTLLYGPKTASGWPQVTDGNGNSTPMGIQLTGAQGTNATLPTDFVPNSVAIAPVSGDATASTLTQKNSSGTTLFSSDTSGNVTVAGTLSVAGASTLAALSAASSAISGNETVGGNLNVTGTATVGALTASGTNIGGNQTVQGNDTINGNLKVLGSTTLAALSASGTSTLAGVTATSVANSGNQTVGGTLGVTGATTLAGASCTTLSASGNTSVGGTLSSTGAATFAAAASVGADLTVVGTCQVKGVNATSLSASGNVAVGGTLTVTGTVNPLGNLNVNGNTVVQGTLNVSQNTVVTGPFSAQASAAITNNLSVGGTLGVTGKATLAGVSATGIANSGNETVGGTLGVTGATTLAALSTTGVTNTGNETIGGTLGVTGAVTASGLVTAKSVTLASGGGGQVTFADGTTQSTAAAGASATNSRSVLDMGGYASSSTSAGFWTTAYGHVNAATPTAVVNEEVLIKLPFPCTITGWSLNQYVANGQQSFMVNKNRTSSSQNAVITMNNVGSATVSGFPGNQFSGTFTKGTYNFAAGDVISAQVGYASGSTTNSHLQLYIEWL